MKIAITPAEPRRDESRLINLILGDGGWDAVHLRHPQASLRDVRNIIEGVSPEFHKRLHLHGHFALSYEFNLGGLHLNGRCPTPPAGYVGVLSKSCHSLNEIFDDAEHMDYVTLSPVFDSLSKSGYAGAEFDLVQLKTRPHCPVVALGGITPNRAKSLNPDYFAGYAVLGYLFNNLDETEAEKILLGRLKEFS